MALGLTSSEQIAGYWSKNSRRRVFYDFPNGTAPLAGLLSMMDSDSTPMQEFGWFEERWSAIKTLVSTAGPTATVVFYQGGTTTTVGTPATITAGDSVRVYVDDASNFQVDDSVGFFNLDLTGGTVCNLLGRVTKVNTSGSDYLEFEATNTPPTTVLNSANANEAKYVYWLGSAFAEGSRSRTGRNKFPSEIKNFTQIHKNAFELTRNALKEPLVYDKTGHYHKALKDNGIDHLTGIEWSLYFGKRRQTTDTDPDSGQTVRRYFSGGLLWFLEQWELGSVSAGGAFEYGQSDVSSQTDWQTYTNKRIIRLGGATITRAQFNEINSRVFEKTNNVEWCKLCLCGPGYINRVADTFEKQIQFTSLRENGFKGFDFELIKHSSNSGTVYYKQHPLFNEPMMRNSAFYIDLGYWKWRPVEDSDTDIQQGIQMPDADKRKDQYLTDGGSEIAFPEANMFVDQLGGITL